MRFREEEIAETMKFIWHKRSRSRININIDRTMDTYYVIDAI